MKTKLTDEIKETVTQSLKWAKLEVEYIKLTAIEKMIVLTGTMILGAVILLFMLPVLIMLLFALADVFKLIMAPALAYLTVGGIVILLLIGLFLARRPLIFNPVARFLTKTLLERPKH